MSPDIWHQEFHFLPAERLAALPDLAAVLDPELPGSSAWDMARGINAHRPEGHTMVVVRPLDVTFNATQAGGRLWGCV